MSKKAGDKKVVSFSFTPFQFVFALLLQTVLLAVLHVDAHTPPGKEAGKSRVLPVYQSSHRGIGLMWLCWVLYKSLAKSCADKSLCSLPTPKLEDTRRFAVSFTRPK